jgi:ubiquinone/menaquinone biosynthesis C-methylase UbiE
MDRNKNRVCPVEQAGRLDSRFRRWLQDPRKILYPYVNEGMTVLDHGCGPGFFSMDMAEMVGSSGRVIASDLQEGMLERLGGKIQGTELAKRIILHKCQEDRIGWTENVDFVLLFYVMHEIPDQRGFFKELHGIVQPMGQILVVEPPIHVSMAAFAATIRMAQDAGFTPSKGPKVLFSKSMILRHC